MPSHFATHERVQEHSITTLPGSTVPKCSATQHPSTAPRQWLQPVSPPTLEAFAANPALLRFSSTNNAGSPIHMSRWIMFPTVSTSQRSRKKRTDTWSWSLPMTISNKQRRGKKDAPSIPLLLSLVYLFQQ
jgi:hypothetical protein